MRCYICDKDKEEVPLMSKVDNKPLPCSECRGVIRDVTYDDSNNLFEIRETYDDHDEYVTEMERTKDNES